MFFVLAATVSLAAQARTITNADLEKYRIERLTAEREYRENYAKLGMPSPTELERRCEQSRIEATKLSEKLRAEQLERERAAMENERLLTTPIPYIAPILEQSRYSPVYFGSYYRNPIRRHTRRYQQPGYFAAGLFIPTGSETRSAPMFRRGIR